MLEFSNDSSTLASGLYAGFFGSADVYLPSMSNDDYKKAVSNKWAGEFFRDNLDALMKYRDHRAFQSLVNVMENLKNYGDPAAASAFARQAEIRQAFAQAEQNKRMQQEQADANRRAGEQNRQAQAAADTAKLRAEIATQNPGQLFVKANELASSGDSAKAQEVRNALISRFPDHALAAQVCCADGGWG